MRISLYFLMPLAGLIMAGAGCNNSSSDSIKTTKALSTPAISGPINHTPYAIADSSNVRMLEGGVKMYIIEEGQGPIPSPTSTVIAHYHGMLTDGTVFDSSFERGQTTSFPLTGVIKGWTVALSQVRTGSKVKLIIPPDMGYGAQASGKIPANSTLIFDVDLVSTYD